LKNEQLIKRDGKGQKARKKAEKKGGKDKVKTNQKKAIDWDSDSYDGETKA